MTPDMSNPSGAFGGARLPAAFMVPGTSSFTDFLAGQAPDLLPSRRSLPPGRPPTWRPTAPPSSPRPTPAEW